MKKLLLLSTSLALLFAATNTECMNKSQEEFNKENYKKRLEKIKEKYVGYNTKEILKTVVKHKTKAQQSDVSSVSTGKSSLFTKGLLLTAIVGLTSGSIFTITNNTPNNITAWGNVLSYQGKVLIPGQSHTTNWVGHNDKEQDVYTEKAHWWSDGKKVGSTISGYQTVNWLTEDGPYETSGCEHIKSVNIKENGMYDMECYEYPPFGCHKHTCFRWNTVSKDDTVLNQQAKRKVIE